MTLKEQVLGKVPPEMKQTREFKAFLQILDEKNLADSAALKMFLDSSIAQCQKRLKEYSDTSTGQTLRRKEARHLEFYRTIHEKVLPYLE